MDHAAIRAAIEARLRAAKVVGGTFEQDWVVQGRKVMSVEKRSEASYEVAQAKNVRAAHFIANLDPASAIRLYDASLGLLDILSDSSLHVEPDLLVHINRLLTAIAPVQQADDIAS